MRNRFTRVAPPKRVLDAFALDAVKDRVDAYLETPMWSTLEEEYRLELTGEEIAIVATSTSPRIWMLPWTVRFGEETWTTKSALVPKALWRVWKASSLESRPFTLDFAEQFFDDGAAWSDVSRAFHHHAVETLLRRLPGAKHAGMWTIEEGVTGMGYDAATTYSATAMLSRADDVLVDRIWWRNPLDPGPPTSWTRLLRVHEAANRAAGRLPWLRQWKARSPGRRVELQVRGVSIADLKRGRDVWRRARLRGRPDFELILRDEPRGMTKVYLGSKEARSVITWTTDTHEDSWLAAIQPALLGEAFAIVEPDGVFEIFRDDGVSRAPPKP